MTSRTAEGPAQPPASTAADKRPPPTSSQEWPPTGPAADRPTPAGAAAPEDLPHPNVDEIELAAVLHALSDPMRLQIVRMLADGSEQNCKSIGLPVTKSTATHHFRVLREAGVLHQRLLGTTRLNALRRADLDARFPGLLDAVLQATVVTE